MIHKILPLCAGLALPPLIYFSLMFVGGMLHFGLGGADFTGLLLFFTLPIVAVIPFAFVVHRITRDKLAGPAVLLGLAAGFGTLFL